MAEKEVKAEKKDVRPPTVIDWDEAIASFKVMMKKVYGTRG